MSAVLTRSGAIPLNQGLTLDVVSFEGGFLMLTATAASGCIGTRFHMDTEQAAALIAELQAGIAAAKKEAA